MIVFLCEEGQLRKFDPQTKETTDEKYEFFVKDDHEYNQKRYEDLGEVKYLNNMNSAM
jgi:hypothetical protein